jgi:N-glycosylase/DNA lyase
VVAIVAARCKTEIVAQIRKLVQSDVGKIVRRRMAEFRRLGKEGKTHFNFKPFLDVEHDSDTFSELCFCILTANSTAKLGIKIQRELGSEGFLHTCPEELARKLKMLGHRFPNSRAGFIVEARRFDDVGKIVAKLADADAREWLAENVKGIGWKEASHFLRNIGRRDLAILDRHVLSVMCDHRIIPKAPQTLTKNKYLEAEGKLSPLAAELELSLGELDLYLWYMKVGKVLK